MQDTSTLRTRLELADGTILRSPSSWEISESLRSLEPEENNFAILATADEVYIQTATDEIDSWVLEYRDGSADRHFGASVSDVERIISAFTRYAEGDRSWLEDFQWEPVSL